MSEKILEVKHLGKAFGSNQVLRDIDFSVCPGDVTCIIGPSGSGKSTLLRCLNMLETPSSGEINYHGTDITSKNVNVPEYRSKVGMVFQRSEERYEGSPKLFLRFGAFAPCGLKKASLIPDRISTCPKFVFYLVYPWIGEKKAELRICVQRLVFPVVVCP